ncbi:type II toxin-antitoxin system VapC family toxin [Pseudonocardia spinosispora]|uniref:type II toxin-antitoxin system VapC family toxin n=1 Tax=Pseudonocardia spinosispora TaxID=103441 RepID=UPI00041A956A|nr:PIN domain-containing protein [Pseudonocardia spinosispora]
MGSVVLDSSIVIGFFDAGDAHHAASSAALIAMHTHGDTSVLPATVLLESLVGSYRRNENDAVELRRRILALFGPIRIVDEDIVDAAARLRAAHRWLRTPDSLVLATGVVEDATVLTCDQQLAKVDPRVEVIGSG